MEIDMLCTGDQNTEAELKQYLAKHPKENRDIFQIDIENQNKMFMVDIESQNKMFMER